jgi:hypothetical protein
VCVCHLHDGEATPLVLAVVGDHVQSSIAVDRVLSSAAVHYFLGDLDLAIGGGEAPLGYYDGVVGPVTEDEIHTTLSEATIDRVGAWSAGSVVATLFGIGKGGSTANLFPAPHNCVAACTTKHPVGTQATLHLIRAASAPHGVSAGATVHVIGTGGTVHGVTVAGTGTRGAGGAINVALVLGTGAVALAATGHYQSQQAAFHQLFLLAYSVVSFKWDNVNNSLVAGASLK